MCWFHLVLGRGARWVRQLFFGVLPRREDDEELHDTSVLNKRLVFYCSSSTGEAIVVPLADCGGEGVEDDCATKEEGAVSWFGCWPTPFEASGTDAS